MERGIKKVLFIKKIVETLIGVIISLILVFTIDLFTIDLFPVKKVERNIDTVTGECTAVDDKSRQIYVEYLDEGSGWLVVGKDGVLFDNEDVRKKEIIFIVGNFPRELNYDLLTNTFVLDGEYLGKKSYANKVRGCFQVNDFGVLGKLKRSESDWYLSKSSLTVSDYIAAQVIPYVTLDDLKDAEE